MKTLVFSLMACCVTALPAQAGMEAAFRNTVVSTYPSGLVVRHWFNGDGSYQSSFSDGRSMTGRWAVEGKKVCLSHIRPRMILSRFCTELVEADIGGTWPSRDPLGRRVQNQLVAGR